MKKIYLLFTLFVFIITSSNVFAEATYENARHRLPPVIYSLDIPYAVQPGNNYSFNWTVMGYHETYDIIIVVYDENGEIARDTVSPYQREQGQYRWDDIWSYKFSYTTNLFINFSGTQPIIVRFFASPVNDPIDNTFLSCLVPGGLGYESGDTSGRKIKIAGID